MPFSSRDQVFAPKITLIRRGDVHVAVDAEAPNWATIDERGARVLSALDQPRTVAELEARLCADGGAASAWLDLDTLLAEAERAGLVGRAPLSAVPYTGRGPHLGETRLEEFWIHINDYCNLRCAHCLVSSGPDQGRGLPPETVRRVALDAYALGARTFLITGGEPLFRDDLPALLEDLLDDPEARAVVLTNGIALRSERLGRLAALRDRLSLQISLDGPDAQTNDAVRGAGTFGAILDGIRAAVGAGVSVTVCAVVTTRSAPVLELMAPLCCELGVRNLHLLWPHRRGRALIDGLLPSTAQIVDAYRRVRKACRDTGVALDNEQSLRLRLDSPPGRKHDLSGAGITSLCLYTDGRIYPSAATAGVPELAMGDALREPLAAIWHESSIARRLRGISVVDKKQCRSCEYRFLCGGGDLEHGYFFSGSLLGDDPYCDLYKEMIGGALEDMTAEAAALIGRRGGFLRPVLLRTMGERAIACGVELDGAPVATTRSVCVLSVDVIDRSRALMRDFYAQAAETPQAGLCCPVKPSAEDLAHIPAEVVDRFYGCGSPVSDAGIALGEVVVDLGSGGGIDCFVAARRVGATGRVIGVDMTDAMIDVATRNREPVARNLGWDVVEFKRGLLEDVPVQTATADLVVSNCVVNLSPDKRRVFSEMWRVLKDGGRVVLSDIVSEGELPPDLKVSVHLWGECLGGALSEREFLDSLERAGFFGVQILKKTFWREVERRRFFSLTVRAYKYEKKEGCVFVGHRAVYLGPLKAGIDEEGHLFPRGEAIDICTDTAAKLRAPGYASSFAVLDPTSDGAPAGYGCDPAAGCC